MIPVVRVICLAFLLSAFPSRAAGEDFTNAIRAFLPQRVEIERRDPGLVIGLVDEHGSQVSLRDAAWLPEGAGKKVNSE